MLWEGRRLRDITQADLRQIIDSELEEHLQLEYKSALYEDNDHGRREFLLDACMFANAEGGVLLIGVPERRDGQGHPTGVPNPGGALGVNVANPEAVLLAMDARVVAAIEERLPLEAAPIDVGNGLHVIVIRVRNSPSKPHCVRYQGHVYFPSRRERHRYEMDVREIKELVMRTASRLNEARHILKEVFLEVPRSTDAPYFMAGVVPVFWKDYLVDIRNKHVRHAVRLFGMVNEDFREPTYGFTGLQRRGGGHDITVQVRRNGLVSFSRQLPIRAVDAGHTFYPTAIDLQLRKFVLKTREVYQAAGLSAPYLLSMALRTMNTLAGVYLSSAGIGEEVTPPIPPGDYLFPVMQVDDLFDTDSVIRPLCDQVHQTFGRDASPFFNAQGVWTGPNM